MKKDIKSVLSDIRSRIKPENKAFVRKNLEISNQIQAILDEKGWSQKDFAQKLGKHESEVSKWLSGLHNLTLESIAKMEAVLESDIITTPLQACSKYKSVHYIPFTVDALVNQMPEKDELYEFNKIVWSSSSKRTGNQTQKEYQDISFKRENPIAA